MKFKAINSYYCTIHSLKIEALFKALKLKFKSGFTSMDLNKFTEFKSVIPECCRSLHSYANVGMRTNVLNNLKTAGAIKFNHTLRKWIFTDEHSSSSAVESALYTMRQAERKLLSLGYIRKQRAIYERTTTSSVTV